MPEGDTVLQTANRLHSALAGRVLTRSDLRVPRFATADLTGRTVLDVISRGKHLLTRIEGGLTLHSHLQMDGAWRVYAPGERWRGGPAHQIRAVLANAEHTAVGYRLPVLELLRTRDEEQAVGHLGPDLLGPDWNADTALHNLLSDPARPLGEALPTSAIWPESATSTRPSSASSPVPPPGSPSATWPPPPPRASSPRPSSSSKPTATAPCARPPAPRPADTARASGSGSTAGPTAPACAAAHPSAQRTRTPARPTGVRAASRAPQAS